VKIFLRIAYAGVIAFLAQSAYADTSANKPNIVFVLCDDLGYGDVQCLNPERGKIPTPGVDRLARERMIDRSDFSRHTEVDVLS
jgi:hypothetical protein